MTSLLCHRGGSGPPLVLLHGVASSWRDWTPVVDELERSWEVFALGFPGHYGMPPFAPGITPGVDALARAVCAAMDELAIDCARVAGSSLGGWIAFETALMGRASSVVAFSPAGLCEVGEARALRRRILRQHRIARLAAPLAPLVARSPALAGLVMGGRRGSVRPREVAHKLLAFAACPILEPLLADLEHLRAEALAGIDCPVLVAWGEDDRLLPVRFADRFAAALPGARVVRLPGAGHLPMWDDPGGVAELIGSVAAGAPIRHAGRR
jgi:pimeloyl-ACP methyl ester carboxylesterase